MIEARGLIFKYEKSGDPVLKDISLEILEGTYVAIIGPNGCGKSSLLRHLDGLLLPDKGELLVDGMRTRDTGSLREIRRMVGMVFQNPDTQIVGTTVEEDVSFGPGNLGLPPLEIRERVDTALDLVGMKKYAKRPPHTLSSGEKQLVAIAGVLAMHPKYIALDEPTAYLDPSARMIVFRVLKKLHQEGIAIIHVTHHMEEIVDADEIFVMNGGKIIQRGKPAEVLTRIAWLKELGLGAPRVTELLCRLKGMGLDIIAESLTLDDACAQIFSLIEGKASEA
ncbi:MAG: energy-coupling factor transporter ATPase [Desulfatiglandaceae bacterium]